MTGCPLTETLPRCSSRSKQSEKNLVLREELMENSQKYCEERITYLDRLLEEKDARIQLRQERVEQQDAIIKKLLNNTTQQNEEDHA